jgi:glycerol-3-phosphate O-acyltransferase
MYFLYRPVVEREPLQRFNDHAPKGSVVVYVINHRSNADYILVAHMLFKFISLSYAVGEWARVWPLNHLFKWFGAYFIRRRYREPLYHAVLSNFVRTITRNGVTQGIFIEGGLSRDGAFGKPKLGMLDYIVSSKRDPEFTDPLFIIPTAINYDRVLEDRNLTEELLGHEDRSGKMRKLATTTQFLFKNTIRSVVRRFKRYGYAVVAFGEPISVDDFAREHPALLAKEFEQRKPEMQRLAETVMASISRALPVTPVALLATIFSDHETLSEPEIVAAIEERRAAWPDRNWLLREKDGQSLWNAAREVLLLRHLIESVDGCWRWNPDERVLLRYYANSLASFEKVKARGWRDNSVPVTMPSECKAAAV